MTYFMSKPKLLILERVSYSLLQSPASLMVIRKSSWDTAAHFHTGVLSQIFYTRFNNSLLESLESMPLFFGTPDLRMMIIYGHFPTKKYRNEMKKLMQVVATNVLAGRPTATPIAHVNFVLFWHDGVIR